LKQSDAPLLPTRGLFYTCCRLVSRVSIKRATRDIDPELQATFGLLQEQLGPSFQWPSRAKLTPALGYASIAWITNIMVDLKRNLVTRLQRWLFLRFRVLIRQDKVTDGHRWAIACHIVSTLVWEEKRAVAQALARDERPPAKPVYRRPESIEELLGASLLDGFQPRNKSDEGSPALKKRARAAIWRVFTTELLPMVATDALPICPSNFGETALGKK
jgi:hypothetical protein